MLIIPSKELLLITAEQSKEIFLFDPKTTSVSTKYHSEPSIARTLAYYPQSNQFLTSFNNKTFVSVWSTDCQEPLSKISTSEMITCLQVSKDKNVLFGGSNTGNLYIWELPCGILIRKTSVHSGEIKKIIEYKSGYLMTCSQRDVKMWSLSSFYIETERSTPIKIINSILDIIDVEYTRNIFIVLTSKSVTYYLGGNEHNPFPQISKEDIEFPTTICSSLSHVYIGDCQGSIYVNEIATTENTYEIDFHYNQDTDSMEVNKLSKKVVLKSQNKHPITSLTHLKTLPYLISGNTEGDVCVWQNHSLKRSIKLFKTSIKFIYNIPKPLDQKISQNLKIRPLAKYQQNKETEPLEVDIVKLRNQEELNQNNTFELQRQIQHIQEEVSNQIILQRMLQVLNRPDEILRGKISQLEHEKQKLIKANLHYSAVLNQQRERNVEDFSF